MAVLETLELKISRLRYRGIGGKSIPQHRSLHQLTLNVDDLLMALLLPIVFNMLLLLYLNDVLLLWRSIFAFWLEKLGTGASVGMGQVIFGDYLLHIPLPALDSPLPGAGIWWGTLFACILLFIATYFIPPERFLPVVYVARACLLIQATALAYFFLLPASFPYDLHSYLTDELGMSLLFLFIAPWIVGLTYCIFDFSLLQKIALIGLIFSYFIIALPMQYLLHALLLARASLLFLPVCYLAFGIFIDVMLFVALYAWGMSWRFGRKQTQQ